VSDNEKVFGQSGFELRFIKISVRIDGNIAAETIGSQHVVDQQFLLPRRILGMRDSDMFRKLLAGIHAAVVIPNHHESLDGILSFAYGSAVFSISR
jgi:hypothetical protein